MPLAQVNVMINGYSYTLGCDDGQESHLLAMAAEVEGRMDSIKALGTSTSEQRLLVLAALLMADELHDMRGEIDGLRAQLAKPGRGKAESRPDAETGRKLSRLAERAEQIANGLEQP
jgi:cell division protein ZapA